MHLANPTNEQVTVKDIPLMRFRLKDGELDNSTKTPSQADYYAFGPTGFVNVTNCFKKVPVWCASGLGSRAEGVRRVVRVVPVSKVATACSARCCSIIALSLFELHVEAHRGI